MYKTSYNLRKYVLIIISFARCHNIILNKHNKFEDSEVCEEENIFDLY